MIEVLRDEQGNITAVIEYLLFENGQMDDNGTDMVIGHMEVNPLHRNNGCIKSFIRMLLDKCPQAKRCYFVRELKYHNFDRHEYTREQFERLIGG